MTPVPGRSTLRISYYIETLVLTARTERARSLPGLLRSDVPLKGDIKVARRGEDEDYLSRSQ